MTERQDQEALFTWIEYNRERLPGIERAFAVPNGAWLAGDATTRARIANSMKRQGMRPGVPDILIPIARGGYHGLFVELKHGGNKPSPEQLAYIQFLEDQHYFVVVCYGWEAAVNVIEVYMSCAK
jgi:hypothetical protein